ncbi:MAG: hypothetical protein WCA84_11830 [Ignavibacteriaceae bacterium]
MQNKNNLLGLNLQQTRLQHKIGRVEVFVRQHNFHAGTIDLINRTFTSVSRSSKNVFRLFGGGLGLNSEILFIILPYYSIETIIIPFEGRLLKTLADKWRTLGITSPFCNDAVDKQIILSFDLLNMDDANKYAETVSVRKPNYQLALNF